MHMAHGGVAAVQIVAGAHHVGDLGVVAHAADGVASVLLDATDETVKVLVNNLVETAQERSGIEALGRYRINDLVELRDGTVGMIVRLSAATAHILSPGASPLLTPPLCTAARRPWHGCGPSLHGLRRLQTPMAAAHG